jgi:hypothetical protein
MVLPQYTFAALAIGAIAAIAVTLYATLGARQQQRIGYGNRTHLSGSGDRSRCNRYRQYENIINIHFIIFQCRTDILAVYIVLIMVCIISEGNATFAKKLVSF